MKDELPGVHLRVTKSDLKAIGSKKTASITLVGEVHDEDIWKVVLSRLHAEGMKIYSVDDFKTELVNAMRMEVRSLESRVQARDQEVRELQHQLAMLRLSVGNIASGR